MSGMLLGPGATVMAGCLVLSTDSRGGGTAVKTNLIFFDISQVSRECSNQGSMREWVW